MNRSRFAALVVTSAFLVALLIAGCPSNSIEGVYTVPTGEVSLEFKQGKAYLTMGPLSFPDGMPYEVKGDKILLHNVPNAGGMFASNMTLTRNSDGTLTTDWGRLKKKGS